MGSIPVSYIEIWGIAAVATGGVVIRPWGWPEALWAVLGAGALVVLALLPWQDALSAVGKGADVYLFLTGMMLLAELARREGLFDWLAAHAAKAAKGSAARLFSLVYMVGIVVTAFLSNDATAVVLTPAVYAAAKAAKAEPLPYLVVCAFIANAASFILPISNPANLVLYNNHMPPLPAWLRQFALPSLLSIAATYVVLRWLLPQAAQARDRDGHRSSAAVKRRPVYGLWPLLYRDRAAHGVSLGDPARRAHFHRGRSHRTFRPDPQKKAPWPLLSGVSWGVLPLVAGLFVLVAGLNATGVVASLSALLQRGIHQSEMATAWIAGAALAAVTNIMNNLPAGLIAESAIAPIRAPETVRGALLIGVDLGPNLSVTGSLATILWLLALRREGEHMGAWDFMRIGAMAMAPALVLALGALILTS